MNSFVSLGKLMMFFGCRSETNDYFFKTDWEQLKEKKQLLLFNSFSRDQVCLPGRGILLGRMQLNLHCNSDL